MITVYTGLPGSGKTVMLARKALALLEQARTLERKHNVIRKVKTNVALSPLIVKEYGKYLEHFTDLYTMHQWKDCDIVIDELAVYFDSHEWERTTQDTKAFLRLHRHYKVNIWGVAQDFLTVDKSFRRLTAHLYHIDRIFAFREPTLSNPEPKHPFLLSVIREVMPTLWEVEKEYYQYIPATTTYEFFTKKDFSIFDTHADLPPVPLPPLKREIRVCPDDGYVRKRYI